MSMWRNWNQSYSFGSILGIPTVGTRGAEIPSVGDAGPAFIYPLLNLPTDDDVEFWAMILNLPPGLVITTNENGTGIASGPDGTYIVPFELYADNLKRQDAEFHVTFGENEGLTVNATPANAVASGVKATISLGRIVAAQPGNAVASGVKAAITKTLRIAATPANAIASGVKARIHGDGVPGGSAGGPFNIIIRRRRR